MPSRDLRSDTGPHQLSVLEYMLYGQWSSVVPSLTLSSGVLLPARDNSAARVWSSREVLPKGSSAPTIATAGYYTTWKAYTGSSVTGEQLALQYVEGNSLAIRNQTTRSNQHICDKGSYCITGVKRLCPAGTYGATDGLSTAACTAPCPAGFYW
ncbi:hypothetical protein GQ600_14949 [Phytophthora cactorum]|nr:hypothetical protein GQ600_14949 [Phytophthora cactorum]